jgi:hypothetical protein
MSDSEVFDPTQDGLEEAPVYRAYPEGKYLVKLTQYEPKVSKAGNNMHEVSLRVEEPLDDQDMQDTENNFPLRMWLQHRPRDKKNWRKFIGTFNSSLLDAIGTPYTELLDDCIGNTAVAHVTHDFVEGNDKPFVTVKKLEKADSVPL